FFLAVKKMAEFPVPGFENGGALWFQNLTIPDPYYILPLLISTIFSVLQSVLMNNKTIRRYLDLPAMPQTLKKPEKKPFQEYLKQWNSDVRKNIREQQKRPERL
ncbi:4072_t:CDS:2, partial [Racocetra fulgida]